MASRPGNFVRIDRAGAATPLQRELAVEMPVAIEFNGIGYAVMMMTPHALDDFAYGFARAERLIETSADLIAVESHAAAPGMLLRVTLAPHCVDPVLARVRHRISESSCGLCGIENLEQALRPLPRVSAGCTASDDAIFAALGALRDHQPLNAATGAVHAAALCSATGEIRLAREDVGRHNAFDKLIGAMLRAGLDWDGGFALLSARASYELVEKAVLANCPQLVTISAPTTLAVERAAAAGLTLISLARSDSWLVAAP